MNFPTQGVNSNDCSLHGPLGSGTSEYFICDSDLLDASPVVFVTPDIPPPHKEEHGNHRDCEATEEGLLADDREEQKGQHRGRQTVLEATELVLRDPVLTILEIDFGCWRDACFVDEEVHKLDKS